MLETIWLIIIGIPYTVPMMLVGYLIYQFWKDEVAREVLLYSSAIILLIITFHQVATEVLDSLSINYLNMDGETSYLRVFWILLLVIPIFIMIRKDKISFKYYTEIVAIEFFIMITLSVWIYFVFK
jgi:hypothetical protein